jgi:hypothetical protein
MMELVIIFGWCMLFALGLAAFILLGTWASGWIGKLLFQSPSEYEQAAKLAALTGDIKSAEAKLAETQRALWSEEHRLRCVKKTLEQAGHRS